MYLGDQRKMINLAPIDETEAPIEPDIALPADVFDALVAHLDEPDEAPALAKAAQNRG